MFLTWSRNAKPDDDLGILMTDNTARNENSIDWDAYKMHHKDLIHYNDYVPTLGNTPEQHRS